MKTDKKMDDQKNTKTSPFKMLLNGLAVMVAGVMSATGFYWIMGSEEELPTGAAIVVVGSLMAGITLLKSLAENKRDKVSQVKVIGPEALTGFGISVVGIVWHYVG